MARLCGVAAALLPLIAAAAAAAAAPGLQVYGVRDLVVQRGAPHAPALSWKLRGDGPVPSDARVEVIVCARGSECVSPAGAVAAVTSATASRSAVRRLVWEQVRSLAIGVYTYRLRVAGSAFSDAAALLVAPAAEDWSATWICSSPSAHDAGSSTLAANFSVAGGAVSSALLSVVGLGQSLVFLNGASVDTGAVTPAVANWKKRTYFGTYDVSDALQAQPGAANLLEVHLGNGMYNVPDPGARYTKFKGSYGPRMLLAQLDVTFTSGATQRFVTAAGAPWLATEAGPTTFNHVYGGEDYDASKEVIPAGAWAPAQSCSAAYPGGALQPATHPAVRVMRRLSPVSLPPTTPTPGTFQFDFGINHSGFPTLLLNLSGVVAPVVVTATPAELRHADGTLDQGSGGTPVYWRFTAVPPAAGAPSPLVSVAPRFHTYGWRWLDVQNVNVAGAAPTTPGLPTLVSATSNYVHSAMEPVGTWTSSSATLNGIHALTRNAILSNAHVSGRVLPPASTRHLLGQ